MIKMECSKNDLKKKIGNYLNGTLSKDDLGGWAEHAYYDLLKGGYIEQKKMAVYPFLKKVSQIHLPVNDVKDIYPSAEEDIRLIYEILTGQKEFACQIETSVPIDLYERYFGKNIFPKYEIYKSLINEIRKCCDGEKNNEQLCDLLENALMLPCSNDTILDLLQKQITKLCRALYDAERKELTPSFRLYVKKTGYALQLLKLQEYLECYTGGRNFLITILYAGGIPEINVCV